MKKYSEEQAEHILRENELKITPIRTALIISLSENKIPLTIQEIAKSIKKTKANTSTIYRALTDFAENKIIERHLIYGDKISYTLKTKNHKHYIVCSKCKTIEPIAFCVRGINNNAVSKSKMFKKISGHAMSFMGTCRKCTRSVR